MQNVTNQTHNLYNNFTIISFNTVFFRNKKFARDVQKVVRKKRTEVRGYLVFVYDVCKEEVDQQERQDEWSQEEVGNSQKSKKQNPGDFPMVINIWKIKFVWNVSVTAAALS